MREHEEVELLVEKLIEIRDKGWWNDEIIPAPCLLALIRCCCREGYYSLLSLDWLESVEGLCHSLRQSLTQEIAAKRGYHLIVKPCATVPGGEKLSWDYNIRFLRGSHSETIDPERLKAMEEYFHRLESAGYV